VHLLIQTANDRENGSTTRRAGLAGDDRGHLGSPPFAGVFGRPFAAAMKKAAPEVGRGRRI
jgi:hypothetical protein